MPLFENPFAAPTQQVANNPAPGGIPGVPRNNQQGDVSQGTSGNNSGVVPGAQDTQQGASGTDTTTGGAGHDPLTDFNKLWEDEAPDPNAPKNLDTGYLPAIDNTKLGEYVNSLDFTRSITPQELSDITAGGEKATQTLLGVINKVARQSVLMGFNSSRKLIETGFTKAEGKFSSGVPNVVRDVMIRNGLTSSNPMMQDGRFAPLVEGVRQRFQSQYPKATPSQIEEAVNKYFDTLIDSASKKKEPVKSPQQQEEANAVARRTGDPNANFEDWFNS